MPINTNIIGRKSTFRAAAVCGALLTAALVPTAARADVKLPAIFSNHMVLQRDVPIKIWGWADPGEEVRVEIGGRTQIVTADDKRHWAVTLEGLPAGVARTLSVHGKNTLVAQDVLIGDVWVCSGQSNMTFALKSAKDADKEIEAARFPSLRHFAVKRTTKMEPVDDVEGEWQSCSPETVPGWSAVAYFFGRELQSELNVPIGLVHTSWGGTPAEAWTSKAAIESVPEFKEAAEKQWKQMAEKKDEPAAPVDPKAPKKGLQPQGVASTLYNGMIAPLVPLQIKGAIWYQGENNAGSRGAQYGTLLPLMISDWRKAFGQGDFPFYIVQLANFGKAPVPDEASGWALVREAQVATAKKLPNVGTAVIIDIGEGGNIHPKNKQDVGKRLALVALAKTYGQDIEYSGPAYESFAVEGNTIRIKFSHAKGLMAKGDKLERFAIAGEDKKFAWADAKIDGETVVVSSSEVTKPVAVRYAWANNPEGANLYNAATLPASPFRTDDWP